MSRGEGGGSGGGGRRSRPQEVAPVATPGDTLDTRYLESLIGYNARRAALTAIGLFLERMAVYGLKPVEFSVLSLIAHNPGATSRQLCTALAILPPNLVGLIAALDRRGFIERRAHPSDGRAWGLHLSPAGAALMHNAEATASEVEQAVTARLSTAERGTLIGLLQKVYR